MEKVNGPNDPGVYWARLTGKSGFSLVRVVGNPPFMEIHDWPGDVGDSVRRIKPISIVEWGQKVETYDKPRKRVVNPRVSEACPF
jgi:hypothetical protein